MTISWFDLFLYTVTLLTLLLQAYLIWLIIYKTPKRMESFRFALIMLMENEFLLTFILGFVLNPNVQFIQIQGYGYMLEGLGRFLGPDGGRYGFALGAFFGAGVFCNQFYCLIYRYAAIQQSYPGLCARFNRWTWRLLWTIMNYVLMISCGIAAFCSIANPEEVQEILRPLIEQGQFPAAESNAVFMLPSYSDGMKIYGIFFVSSSTLGPALCITFSSLIYRSIKANASHFTPQTYKLHLQMTALLIVQFCLPFSLIVPVAYSVLSFLFSVPIGKIVNELSYLLLTIYSLANAMATLAFISPFRDFTLRLLRLKKVQVAPLQIRHILKEGQVVPMPMQNYPPIGE